MMKLASLNLNLKMLAQLVLFDKVAFSKLIALVQK